MKDYRTATILAAVERCCNNVSELENKGLAHVGTVSMRVGFAEAKAEHPPCAWAVASLRVQVSGSANANDLNGELTTAKRAYTVKPLAD